MEPKVIKTEEEYQAALVRIESLMDSAPGSVEEQELEVFTVLIEKYEQEHFPIDLPEPVEAIKFRMEQQGLTQKDLIPYIGSQSKVSEVLNGKRQLSVAMMRALQEGLGIPAKVLLQPSIKEKKEPRYDWMSYPFAEMLRQGYFENFRGTLNEAKDHAQELLGSLFASIAGPAPQPVYCRSLGQRIDTEALAAWQARAAQLAEEQDLPPYVKEKISDDLVREVVKLSKFDQGPLLAFELLQKNGIDCVILPHLPRTYLDGACFKTPSGRPVIGMTLRHDRLDNFWFTLVHELAHVRLHLDQDDFVFFDDTETRPGDQDDLREHEADVLTLDFLLPRETWEQEKINLTNRSEISAFADRLGISPAIVAGCLRWVTNDYYHHGSLLGKGIVRQMFHLTHE